MTKFDVRCRECGERFESSHHGSRFCCREHRFRFNNRRSSRGALLYDLLMTQRFERDKARELQVWSAMCAMASHWRDEDREDLGGRKSWQDARTVLQEQAFERRGPKPLAKEHEEEASAS